MIFSFDNMTCSNNVNYLLRTYEYSVRKYNCSKNVNYYLFKMFVDDTNRPASTKSPFRVRWWPGQLRGCSTNTRALPHVEMWTECSSERESTETVHLHWKKTDSKIDCALTLTCVTASPYGIYSHAYRRPCKLVSKNVSGEAGLFLVVFCC